MVARARWRSMRPTRSPYVIKQGGEISPSPFQDLTDTKFCTLPTNGKGFLLLINESPFRGNKTVGRDFAKAFPGDFSAAFNCRIVFAKSFVEVPVVPDLLDLGVFLSWEIQHIVPVFQSFGASDMPT